MNVEELNLAASVIDRLREAGLDTIAAVLEAGTDGLQAIDGIGPKTASEVLVAAQTAAQGASASDENGNADPKVPMPAAEPDPNAPVTVRNMSSTMVLVGERYLLPGQRRTVRRRQIRHIAAGVLEIR